MANNINEAFEFVSVMRPTVEEFNDYLQLELFLASEGLAPIPTSYASPKVITSAVAEEAITSSKHYRLIADVLAD